MKKFIINVLLIASVVVAITFMVQFKHEQTLSEDESLTIEVIMAQLEEREVRP